MALLEAHWVSVRFGAHRALVDVDLEVDAGTIVGLIGPNGAGKTTMFNAVSGVQPCDGRVLLDGKDISTAPMHKRAWLGLHRTFQRLEVFGSMSAFDNIRTAAEISPRAHRRPRRAASGIAHEVVERLGLGPVAHRRADALPTGQARLVELGRVLAAGPRMVLLDEPASGLDEHETAGFAAVLTTLAADGMGILLVEHDMALVMQLCSRIYVLDLGTVIACGTPAEVREDPRVQAAYLGAVAG
jgi:branched-chain amino acid transport system ATP-binding protein